jgi:hypothetical protein
MKSGFLCLQTHPEHPGLVRVLTQEIPPELAKPDRQPLFRYVARFEDIEAAQMHLHNCMRRLLVDLENRIYRSELEPMIACVEADNLEHTRVWLDPSFDNEACLKIEALAARMRARIRRNDRIWQAIGIAAILMLLLNTL